MSEMRKTPGITPRCEPGVPVDVLTFEQSLFPIAAQTSKANKMRTMSLRLGSCSMGERVLRLSGVYPRQRFAPPEVLVGRFHAQR